MSCPEGTTKLIKTRLDTKEKMKLDVEKEGARFCRLFTRLGWVRLVLNDAIETPQIEIEERWDELKRR